jgi:uncharacterized repeat protein (TIGR01451 family)
VICCAFIAVLVGFAVPAAADPAPSLPGGGSTCPAASPGLVDPSFESPDIAPDFAFVPAAQMAPWQTTDVDGDFEIWRGSGLGVPPYQGDQFIEINANSSDTVYQSIATVPGSTLAWSFAHRGRLVSGPAGSALDTVELLIGSDLASGASQGQFADDDLAWVKHTGTYLVPAGQTTTTFAFRSIDAGPTQTGNLLDSVRISTAPCLTVAAAITGDDAGTVQPGGTFTITYTLANGSDEDASDVQLAAAAPAQTTFVPGSLTVDGAAVGGSPGDVSLGSIGSGGTSTVSYRVVVGAGASGAIAAQATATGAWDGVGPIAPATSNVVSVTVHQPGADLSTSVAVDPTAGPPVAGGPIGFAVTVANAGPDPATSATVTITAPASLHDVQAAPASGPGFPAGGCVAAGQVVTCSFPSLPLGASVPIELTGTLDVGAALGSSVIVTSAVASPVADPDPSNNTGQATAGPVAASADLISSLGISAGADAQTAGLQVSASAPGAAPTQLVAGGPIAYVAAVRNDGPSTAIGVRAVLKLDPALRDWTVTSSVPAACLALGTTVICTFPQLAPHDSVQLMVSGMVASSAGTGTYLLTSTVQAASSQTPDPEPANNDAGSSVPVAVTGSADLSTAATLASPTVSAGGPVDYSVVTANAGPSDAADTIVTIIAPPSVRNPVGRPDPRLGGSCTTTGQVVICSYPSVPAGYAAKTGVSGTVDPDAPIGSSFSMTASSTSATPDPNPANDSPADASTPPGGVRAGAAASGSGGAQLASTGSDVSSLAFAGLVLVLLGTGLTPFGARRRRSSRR